MDLIETAPLHPRGFFRADRVHAIPAGADHLHVEIPASIADIKGYAPPAVAQEWQQAVREAMQSAFAAGFVAVGFSRAEPKRPRYLLERSR